jgi:cell division protein FtsW
MTGVVMILSASSITSLASYGTPWHYFVRQWMWLAVGAGAFVLALRVDHRRWQKPARPLMFLTIALLMAVLVPGIGVSAYGASRWIGSSFLQIQPSEMAKLALVLFAADVLDSRSSSRNWVYKSSPVLVVVFTLIVLVMMQPDMGTTLVIIAIAAAMLFTAGMPARMLGGLALLCVLGGWIMAKAAPYRWRRMTSFLHPFKDAGNTGYQAVQATIALSHGHLLGDGLGAGQATYGYLPNAQTDFIFAVIGEETGFLGGMFLAALFVTFAFVGVRIACRARARFSALVAAGITAWLVGQALINIGAVVGLLPVTGVPLPFVSFGGSSLVIAMFAAGMLGNISISRPPAGS